MPNQRALERAGESTDTMKRIEEALNKVGLSEDLKAWKRRIFQMGYNRGEDMLAKQCGFATATEMRVHFQTPKPKL